MSLFRIIAKSSILPILAFILGFLYMEQQLQAPEKDRTNDSNIAVNKEETPLHYTAPLNVPCEECVYINKSLEVNSKGNPILNVTVNTSGKNVTYQTISGRHFTQDLDRNIAGNASPSPKGEYIIEDETQGYHKETGGVFLPYTPTFNTQRSALGFHVDPSWGKDNGEDGTVGCHAFQTLAEYNSFVNLVKSNDITRLIIDY